MVAHPSYPSRSIRRMTFERRPASAIDRPSTVPYRQTRKTTWKPSVPGSEIGRNRFIHNARTTTYPTVTNATVATIRRFTTPPIPAYPRSTPSRSEEHTSELQSRENLVCRLLLEKKKQTV